MVKRKFGEFLKCRNFTSQRNELVMKLICHNICCLIDETLYSGLDIDFKKFSSKFRARKIEEVDSIRSSRNLKKSEF